MSKSNAFGPGAYTLLNGSCTQVTCDLVKPSRAATAYATALSYPLPLVGVLLTNHGGYTGLSVAMVSTPLVCSRRWMPALLQAAARRPPTLGPLDVPHAATPPPSTAATAVAATKRRIIFVTPLSYSPVHSGLIMPGIACYRRGIVLVWPSL